MRRLVLDGMALIERDVHPSVATEDTHAPPQPRQQLDTFRLFAYAVRFDDHYCLQIDIMLELLRQASERCGDSVGGK